MKSSTTDRSREQFSGSIIVGKDILELLSSAMYVDPLSIYREYIQNSTDSIDEAETQCLYSGSTHPRIEITIDSSDRCIKIRDNGVGVQKHAIAKTLTSIGGSNKRGKRSRGFRGVGRLAGLGYCHELVMRTKAKCDSHVSVLYWDCKMLKELLRDLSEDSLDSIVSKILTLETHTSNGYPDHFFEIEMRNVVRLKNDILLNEDAVSDYISQIGPVPFKNDFSFSDSIVSFLNEYQIYKSYNIQLNGKALNRLFSDKFEARTNVFGTFTDLEVFQVNGVLGDIDAVGWILHSDYLGAIPEKTGVKGLRIRAGNIQVGDERVLDSIFQEKRFNSWCVGECHIVSQKLVPNGRRDDLEQNTHFANLLNHLGPFAKKVSKCCRTMSSQRNQERLNRPGQQNQLNGYAHHWIKASRFITTNAHSSISKSHITSMQKLFKQKNATYLNIMQVLADDVIE